MPTQIEPPSIRQLEAAAIEASENLAYYRRQVVVRTNLQGIAEAKVLVAAWTTTLAARTAALREARSTKH